MAGAETEHEGEGCVVGYGVRGCPDGAGEALRGESEGGEGVLGDLDCGEG